MQLLHVGHVARNKRSVLSLIGTNGLHVEAENKRFSVVGRVVVRTSNLTILRRRFCPFDSVVKTQYTDFGFSNRINAS